MLKRLGARILDRKWMLLIWVAFWALLILSNRDELLRGPGLILFWAAACICSFVCVLLINGMSARDFLLLAGLIGAFFIVIAPFACYVDENYHFTRAFGLSGGRLFASWKDGVLGVDMPLGFTEYTKAETWNLCNVGHSELWLSPVKELEFIARTRSQSYLPPVYLFSAIGVAAGRLMNLPLVGLVLLGRLTNYAAYVAVAYQAIRRAKHYGSLFFLIAVLPCCLDAAGTFSIDAPLIGFSLLYVSIALNYCLDGTRTRISVVDTVLLLVSAAFILSIKYFGYCLLLPLILFAHKRKLENYRSLLWMLAGVLAVIAVWQIWAIMAFPGSVDAEAPVENTSIKAQLAYVLANKGEFISMVGHDFIYNLPRRLYVYTYYEWPAFSFLALPLRFVPFIAAARAKDKYPLELRQRRAFNAYWLLASAVMMMLCILGIYFSFNPAGSNEINAVQFRYILPYMIFVLLPFSTLTPVNNMKNWERRVGFLMALMLVNMTMGTMLNFL